MDFVRYAAAAQVISSVIGSTELGPGSQSAGDRTSGWGAF